MPKLCCAVDCRNIAAATIAVNTSVNVEDSGPPTAPFDSAWKTGQETILWLWYMIIYCRYCCVGRVHHLVSLFCDRWQKNDDARFRFFGALHGLYSASLFFMGCCPQPPACVICARIIVLVPSSCCVLIDFCWSELMNDDAKNWTMTCVFGSGVGE